ncbi:hypothetical protein [Actinocatenispora rupis]|uniref:hypothetical protein n=1 Tax=Actinocatenispora rupis TaxID=519421 RepID=UPI001941DEB2|nr:hypothetical protein [Actinocatenispora rupis]
MAVVTAAVALGDDDRLGVLRGNLQRLGDGEVAGHGFDRCQQDRQRGGCCGEVHAGRLDMAVTHPAWNPDG